jgi:hypothetical protein
MSRITDSLIKIGSPIVGAYKAIPNFRYTALGLSAITLKVLFLVYLWTQYRMYQKLAELPSHSEDALRMSRVYLGAFIVFLVLFVYVFQWFSFTKRQ